jgi:hypothetical protein
MSSFTPSGALTWYFINFHQKPKHICCPFHLVPPNLCRIMSQHTGDIFVENIHITEMSNNSFVGVKTIINNKTFISGRLISAYTNKKDIHNNMF